MELGVGCCVLGLVFILGVKERVVGGYSFVYGSWKFWSFSFIFFNFKFGLSFVVFVDLYVCWEIVGC